MAAIAVRAARYAYVRARLRRGRARSAPPCGPGGARGPPVRPWRSIGRRKRSSRGVGPARPRHRPSLKTLSGAAWECLSRVRLGSAHGDSVLLNLLRQVATDSAMGRTAKRCFFREPDLVFPLRTRSGASSFPPRVTDWPAARRGRRGQSNAAERPNRLRPMRRKSCNSCDVKKPNNF